MKALLCLAVVGALVAAGCSGDGAAGPSPSPSASASAATPDDLGSGLAPTPTVDPADRGFGPHVVAVVDVPSMPRGIAVADGLVWVAAARSSEVVAIDPETNAVVEQLPVGELPVTLVQAASGPMWVVVLHGDATGASTELVRVDTAARAVGPSVQIPAFHAVPVVGDHAWAMGPDGNVRRIDLTSGEVVAEAAVDPATIWIGADEDAVWGVTGAGTAWRLDTETLAVDQTVELGFTVPGRSRVAVGDGRFWVAARDRIVALDAASGERVVDLDLPDLEQVDDLDVIGGQIWLSVTVRPPSSASPMGLLWELDADGSLVAEWPVGDSPSELVVDGDTVWIGNQETNEVLRVLAASPAG